MEKRLGLRAVVFDYGMVLTGPQDPAAHAELVRLTGLPAERFEELYWADRQAYDEGKVTGAAFWRELASEAGLALSEPAIEELVAWDARMWSTENRAMIAWQAALKGRGLLTAIVSNMCDTVHEYIERKFEWIARFDVCVWSYQLRVVKPNPTIFKHVLNQLGTAAGEALFIDDRAVNVEAALALGMRGLVFSTVEKLRSDMVEAGLGAELPLPQRAD